MDNQSCTKNIWDKFTDRALG